MTSPTPSPPVAAPATPAPPATTPARRPAGKRPRPTPPGSEVPTSAFSAPPRTFKRLRRGDELPPTYGQLESIEEFTRNIDGEITRVLGVWSERKKSGSKREWIHVDGVLDMSVFAGDIAIIEAWKNSRCITLAQFKKTDEYRAIKPSTKPGADDSKMSCGYHAVGIALELLGKTSPVTDTMIDKFRQQGARRRKVDKERHEGRGVAWPALSAFIRKLDVIDLKVLEENKWFGKGRGVAGLANIEWDDGIYLVAGKSLQGVGHCFVAEVSDKGRGVFIHDTDGIQRIDWLHKWLGSIMYVRRVVLAAK